MERAELRTKAVALIGAIWTTVDHESWAKQRMEIWRIYQENIEASASTTPDLGRFVNSLCSAMMATPANGSDSAEIVVECVAADWAPQMLALLREEPATVVAMLRVRQQERRDARDGNDNKAIPEAC